MTYTVAQLIAELEQYPEDAEVRLVYQPSWPLESKISGVISRTDMLQYAEPEDDDDRSEGEVEIVYLTEGNQIGYGSKLAWAGQ